MGLPTNIITLLSGNVVANDVNKKETHLTAMQKSLLHNLASAPNSSLREAADETSMGISTVYHAITYFKERSFLEQVGDIKTGFWKCIS